MENSDESQNEKKIKKLSSDELRLAPISSDQHRNQQEEECGSLIERTDTISSFSVSEKRERRLKKMSNKLY